MHRCRPPRRLDDPKLCKNFLLGFCPGEEFQRTKHDYGTCALDHDEAAKAQVRESPMHLPCYLVLGALAFLTCLQVTFSTVIRSRTGVQAVVSLCNLIAAMNLHMRQGQGT